jgi:hypothetical protein
MSNRRIGHAGDGGGQGRSRIGAEELFRFGQGRPAQVFPKDAPSTTLNSAIQAALTRVKRPRR